MNKFPMLCVDLTTWLQEDKRMLLGRSYKGMLQMTEEDEKFEFHEALPQTCERNPTVWTGALINVHQTKDGRYTIQLKRTELSKTLNPRTFARGLSLDLKQAKKDLGISKK